MPIYHLLGFHWHPSEGAGRWFLMVDVGLYTIHGCYGSIMTLKLQTHSVTETEMYENLPDFLLKFLNQWKTHFGELNMAIENHTMKMVDFHGYVPYNSLSHVKPRLIPRPRRTIVAWFFRNFRWIFDKYNDMTFQMDFANSIFSFLIEFLNLIKTSNRTTVYSKLIGCFEKCMKSGRDLTRQNA